MLNNSYPLIGSEDFMSYEFDSIGPKGIIRKLVQYTQIGEMAYYNLGFGNKKPDSNEIDDLIITNNGDSTKVLTTVIKTTFSFLGHFPLASVFATGSTKSRTRLYRIGISNQLKFVENEYQILGFINEEWLPFQKDTDFEAFLISRKASKFEL